MGQRGAKAIAQMLCTNTTLKDLRVGYEPSLTPSDVCVILESLEIPNETLRTLDFDCCEGVGEAQGCSTSQFLVGNRVGKYSIGSSSLGISMYAPSLKLA
jgi:hypothetical protein